MVFRTNYKTMKMIKVTKKENKLLLQNKCPDCLEELKEGPSGGGSINYICTKCGARFNFGLYFERIKKIIVK